ncbi:MAG: histone deacetylase family protein, partial [Actinomycetota bacterium]
PYVTGHADEIGAGRGRGSTLNIPLAARTDDDSYISALAILCESIATFGPSLLIVSLGLDTFFTDPISDLSLTTDGFYRCGAMVRELGIPTVVLQEGGYDVSALGSNVQAWLHGLEGTS